MSMDREPFLRAIEAAPWDDSLARLIYADWLNERSEDDEAERQRQYVDSEKWLREFAAREEFGYYPRGHPWRDDEEDAQDGFDREAWRSARRGTLDHEDSPYERLLYMLTVQALSGDEDGELFLPFETPYDFKDYSDDLWRHFEVITRIKPPEKYRYELPPFRCAC